MMKMFRKINKYNQIPAAFEIFQLKELKKYKLTEFQY